MIQSVTRRTVRWGSGASVGIPQGLGPYQVDQSTASGHADLGREAELVEQGRMLDARADNSLQTMLDQRGVMEGQCRVRQRLRRSSLTLSRR
jgi:hypothetical protein